jgi:hypothetical protein
MALFAPPTSEQWYLLLAPFILPLADGTELPPPAGGIGDYYLDGKCPAIAVNILHGSNGLKSLPEDLFPEFFRP